MEYENALLGKSFENTRSKNLAKPLVVDEVDLVDAYFVKTKVF
jgi:hypothetical protein